MASSHDYANPQARRIVQIQKDETRDIIILIGLCCQEAFYYQCSKAAIELNPDFSG